MYSLKLPLYSVTYFKVILWGMHLQAIESETFGNIMILKANTSLTFEDIVDAIKTYYPKATYHIVWDLTNGSVGSISKDQIHHFPLIAKQYLKNRQGGKTVYVSKNKSEYSILYKLSIVSDLADMPYGYRTFAALEDALRWLERH